MNLNHSVPIDSLIFLGRNSMVISGGFYMIFKNYITLLASAKVFFQ